MAKIENLIEIRHSKVAARFVFNKGKVSPNSERVKKNRHLSNTEKIEVLGRFLNDPVNEKRIEHPFDIPGFTMKCVENRNKKFTGRA